MSVTSRRTTSTDIPLVRGVAVLLLLVHACAAEDTAATPFDIVAVRDTAGQPPVEDVGALDAAAERDAADREDARDVAQVPDLAHGGPDTPEPVPDVATDSGGVGDVAGAEDGGTQAMDAADPEVGEDDASGPQQGPLTGTWARREVHRSQSEAPIIGTIDSSTHSVALVHADHRGESANLTGEICDIRIDTGSAMVEIIMPPAFIASIPFLSRSVEVSPGSAAGSFDFHEPRTVDVRGAIVDDIENSPLPEDAGDPRVWDQDGDGNPGVSVRITGIVDGEMYVVQRAWAELTGTATTEAISGEVEWGQEQIILGTDNELLSYFTGSGDPEGGVFLMVPIPPDADCAWILDRESELFSEAR